MTARVVIVVQRHIQSQECISVRRYGVRRIKCLNLESFFSYYAQVVAQGALCAGGKQERPKPSWGTDYATRVLFILSNKPLSAREETHKKRHMFDTSSFNLVPSIFCKVKANQYTPKGDFSERRNTKHGLGEAREAREYMSFIQKRFIKVLSV